MDGAAFPTKCLDLRTFQLTRFSGATEACSSPNFFWTLDASNTGSPIKPPVSAAGRGANMAAKTKTGRHLTRHRPGSPKLTIPIRHAKARGNAARARWQANRRTVKRA